MPASLWQFRIHDPLPVILHPNYEQMKFLQKLITVAFWESSAAKQFLRPSWIRRLSWSKKATRKRKGYFLYSMQTAIMSFNCSSLAFFSLRGHAVVKLRNTFVHFDYITGGEKAADNSQPEFPAFLVPHLIPSHSFSLSSFCFLLHEVTGGRGWSSSRLLKTWIRAH